MPARDISPLMWHRLKVTSDSGERGVGRFVTVSSRWLPPALGFGRGRADRGRGAPERGRRGAHRVHAVAVRGGEIVAAAGDPELVCFMRSSSKPIQALPLVRARDGPRGGRDRNRVRVSSRHRRPGLGCAQAPRSRRRDRGRPRARPAGGPPRRERSTTTARATTPGCSPSAARAAGRRRATACPSIPSSWRAARRTPRRRSSSRARSQPGPTAAASSRSRSRSSGWRTRSRASSRCRRGLGSPQRCALAPEIVGGPDGADFVLMRDAPGWLAKGGAEGLLCAAGPDGIGVALKTEDGASRAHAPALAAFLRGSGSSSPTSPPGRSSTPAASASARSSRPVDKFFTNPQPVTSIRPRA